MSDSTPIPDPDFPDEAFRAVRPGVVFRLHQGLVRTNNEDWGGWAFPAGLAVFVICDGMGGHEHGEIASRAAGHEFLAWACNTPRRLPPVETLAASLEARLGDLKRQLEVTRMGTTLTGVIVRGNTARVYHVGDSRAYLLRDGRIIQLTRDHTHVDQLEMREEEAVIHPLKHLITRAVGIDGLQLDERRFLLQSGDRLLLCSDGLWNAGLLRRDLLSAALACPDSEQLADDLVGQALKRGAPDNLSLLVVDRDAL